MKEKNEKEKIKQLKHIADLLCWHCQKYKTDCKCPQVIKEFEEDEFDKEEYDEYEELECEKCGFVECECTYSNLEKAKDALLTRKLFNNE